ncbi:Rsd/AlgQ family anti-sigma factor [Algicola sagamiensis]|uniref:Rsd/AlgQ family anti-sigma factor n=1 Tax=Algicola sagamiensis TaxID=163869 RepID=UPI000360C9B3|nr:Rsd/AlgQ family anti-sigma factor [Algicola sagamiensis]
MLSKLEKAQQRWGGANATIDAWLTERQDVLVRYCQLAGISKNGQSLHSAPTQSDIQAFCQILVDYISAGHFEVYDQMLEQSKPDKICDLKQDIYPKISATTDLALDFNDKYAELKQEDVLENFDLDLSQLGQTLELRFSLEDQLIDSLMTKQSEPQ